MAQVFPDVLAKQRQQVRVISPRSGEVVGRLGKPGYFVSIGLKLIERSRELGYASGSLTLETVGQYFPLSALCQLSFCLG